MGVAYHSYTNASHVNVSTYGDIDALAHLLKSPVLFFHNVQQISLRYQLTFVTVFLCVLYKKDILLDYLLYGIYEGRISGVYTFFP